MFPAGNVLALGPASDDPLMKLRWRLEDAAGAEHSGTSPSHVRLSLELQQAAPASTAWMGVAQSGSGLMLGASTGRAAVGLVGSNPPSVKAFDLVSGSSGKTAVVSASASESLFEGSSAFAGAPPTGSQAATDGARAVLVMRRPLVDAESASADAAVDGSWSAVEQSITGFIWAMGVMGQGQDQLAYHSSRGSSSVVLRPALQCDNAVVCSGLGRCDVRSMSVGLVCVCDPGHAGTSCSECASGFVRDASSGRCRLPEQGGSGGVGPGAVSRVVLGLTLDVDFDSVYSADVSGFNTQFSMDVGMALGIAASRVVVESASRGSVIVRFSVTPGETESAAAYNDLVDELGAQVNNATSLLRRRGSLTANVTAGSLDVLGFVLPPAASTGFDGMADSAFASAQELVDGLSVHWSLTDSNVPGQGETVVPGDGGAATGRYLHARVVHESMQGWFALGFNPSAGTMPGSHTVVATLGASSAEEAVREYDLSGRSGFGSGIARDGERSLSNTGLYERNGSWVMEFSRALDTGDSGDHVLPAGSSEGSLFMLVAKHGSADSIESSGPHSVSQRSVVSVDLSTGEVEAVPLAGLIIAHGVMMGIAWAILVPTGVMAARFCKGLGASAPAAHGTDHSTKADAHAAPASVPCWFRTHQLAQGLAVVLTVIAFSVIAAHVGSDKHFQSGHSVVGIVVVVLALLQGVLGAIRPHKGDDWRTPWEWAHKGVGYVATVLGLVAVILGSGLAAEKAGIPVGGWVGVTAAIGAAWVLAEILLDVAYIIGCLPAVSSLHAADAKVNVPMQMSEANVTFRPNHGFRLASAGAVSDAYIQANPMHAREF